MSFNSPQSSVEETPETIIQHIEEFSSPFFTYDKGGVQFWNYKKDSVQKKLMFLGLSGVSESDYIHIFQLQRQDLIDLFLTQNNILGQRIECVFDNETSEVQYFFRKKGGAQEKEEWKKQFSLFPERFKWFHIRFGHNMGYVFNARPNDVIHDMGDVTQRYYRHSNAYVTATLRVLEKKDQYTIGHMQRVAEIATQLFMVLLQRKLRGTLSSYIEDLFPYTPDQIPPFKQAAFLHDIGKINIPDSLLLRDRRIDSSKIMIIQKHIESIHSKVLINQTQLGALLPEETQEIIDESENTLTEVMKSIQEINMQLRLAQGDSTYLDILEAQGYFSDRLNEEADHVLQEALERLHIPVGNLLPWERDFIESHSILSWKIMQQIGSPFAGTALHHKNYNMKGYPSICELMELLYSKDVHFPTQRDYFIGQIIQIADAFDAICTARPYDCARSPYQALKIFKEEAGKQFHPELVDAFYEFFLRDELTGFQTLISTFNLGNASIMDVEEWKKYRS